MGLKKPILIGIAGGTASGKTSFAKILRDDFSKSNSVKIIRFDDYYKDQSDMTMEERVKTNYDHPFAFDFDLMRQNLIDLLDGKTIEKPTYDFTVHNRAKETEIISPSDVLILEGLFSLFDEEIRQLEDIKLYVDTDADIRFIRRLIRDTRDRNRTMDSVITQYLTTVKTMHDQFIEPTKKYADLIIPDGKTNSVAIDLLRTKINSIINEKML